MIKLSLCVPIYGVEKEIPRFLDSLEKNLCEGVEVLLIDDGTKDNSGKIADAFAEKHADCVRVIHKPNGGASSARNTGLDAARGEYIIFPDPDDYMTDAYVSTILDAIEKYDAPDMIFFDYYMGYDEKFKHVTVPTMQEGTVTKEAFFREHIKDKYIRGYVWNKAIKRSIFGDRRFDTSLRLGEDYEMMTELALRMETFVYLTRPLYYYVRRPESLTRMASLDEKYQYYELNVARYQKHSALYDGLSIRRIVISANNLLKRMYIARDEEKTRQLERVIRDNIGHILTSDDYTFNQKKRSLFIWSGIARLYYRWKKR